MLVLFVMGFLIGDLCSGVNCCPTIFNTDNAKEWIAFFLHALRIRVLAALGKQLKFPRVF
jgi:hypothetical protein